jgi:hypothetical protein
MMATIVGLILPLGPCEAHSVTHTLTQTPVTGRLATGGTFHGRLTIHAFTVDEDGQLTAAGVLTGTATTAPRAVTKIPPRPFTALASLLDLRGTCTTVVVDLAPVWLTPLEQEVTLTPVVLGVRAGPQAEQLLRITLCALARLQE